jgi:hypothetical protein
LRSSLGLLILLPGTATGKCTLRCSIMGTGTTSSLSLVSSLSLLLCSRAIALSSSLWKDGNVCGVSLYCSGPIKPSRNAPAFSHHHQPSQEHIGIDG